MKEKLQWAVVIVVSMALGAGVIVGIDSARDDGSANNATTVPITDGTASTPVNEGSTVQNVIQSDVADLVDEVRPSVVKIEGTNNGVSGGLGSGVVLDEDGNILTNNHVIDGFSSLDVIFADGTASAARLIGRDPGNDLAIIRVDDVADDVLVPAKLGSSENVRVGEFVIAIGNPFDLTGSVTTGIVSGIGRTLSSTGGRPLRELIQSDAAINPGNSGGALFNAAGEVIGITTAIENPTGDRVFAGIGYAVPATVAQRFLPDMLAGVEITHPRLGVSLSDVTPAEADSLGLGVDRGVMIVAVDSGSAADQAGLVGSRSGGAGDVIVQMDGQAIETFEDLASYIDSKDVGDTVHVTFVRDGQEQTVDVTLEAWSTGSA